MYELDREMGTCSPGGGYIALPKEDISVDITKLKGIIDCDKFKINFSSNLMLTVNIPSERLEISFFKSGRILFKTYDKDKVTAHLKDMENLVEKAIKE